MQEFELCYTLCAPEAAPAASTLVFTFVGNHLIVDAQGKRPDPALVQARLGLPWRVLQFALTGERLCEMRLWPPEAPFPDGFMVGDYRHLRTLWPLAQLRPLCRAQQLAHWLVQNRFCGCCGKEMTVLGHEPACRCPQCGYLAYPRLSPVCMGLVFKGDAVLLGRSPHFLPGVFSALAGYVEAGETAEEGLRREIREEAGIEIDHIRWFGSQSWPGPHSLMLGFFADYAGGTLTPQAGEIEALDWFSIDALPPLPHPHSLAYAMIEAARQSLGR